MIRKAIVFTLIATFVLGLGIVGIASAAKSITVGFSISTLNNPYFVAVKEEAEKTAKRLGVNLIIVDAQNDPVKQLRDAEDLIQKHVDVLVLDPTDSDSIIPAIVKANKANIPVVTVDRKPNLKLGGKVITHSASDNVTAGRMSAEFIAKKLDGKGNVVILEGILGTSAAVDRTAGFMAKIKEYKGIKVLTSQTADFDRAKGMSVMENLLQAYDHIDAVYAENDEMALGAIRAIKAAGRQNEMFVTGIDATDDGLRAVQNGELAMTITMRPDLMGRNAVELAVGAYNGKKYPDFVEIPIGPVTKENISEYLKK